MKTPRSIVPALFFLLVGGLLAVAGDPPVGRPTGPTTLGELDEGLTKATERVERLLTQAGRDRRFQLIDKYSAYAIEDFRNRRREVEAEDLLDIIEDADAPPDLRQDAFDALTGKEAMLYDPDLLLLGERGKRKPRAEWSRNKVTKLLTCRDEHTRNFAHKLLITYFDRHKGDTEIVIYDAFNGPPSQWKKARSYWNKVLRK